MSDRTITVTVTREVVETWHYTIDASALDIPSEPTGSPALDGEYRSRIYEAITGTAYDSAVLGETLNESYCTEMSVEDWSE